MSASELRSPNRPVTSDDRTSFVRFGLTGAASFTLILGLTVGLHELLGVSEEAAFAVGLGAALIVNFLACRYLVFRGAAVGSAMRQFLLFVGSSLAFRGMEYLAFLGAHTLAGVHYVVASLVILGASTVLKFFYFGRVVFSSERGALPAREAWFS